MKYRLVFIVVAIASLLTACDDNASNEAVQTPQGNAEQVAQQPTRYRSVSHEEYSASDLDMQRLIDLMDGAVNALFAVRQNGANWDYEAMIVFSTLEDTPLANTIIIAKSSQHEQELTKCNDENGVKETCVVRGIGDGMECCMKIREKMKAGNNDDLDIKVRLTRENDVEITY